MTKTEFTKRCIADALFELLKTKKLHEISVKDVVEKAGFSRMSYYRNFNSFEETLHYFLDVHAQAFSEKKQVSMAFKHIKEALPMFVLALQDEERREIDEVFIAQGLEYIIFENNRRHIFATSPADHLYSNLFISGGFNEIWYKWIKSGHKGSPEEIVKVLDEQISRDLSEIFKEYTPNNEE